MHPPLPIDDVLPEVIQALRTRGRLVLQAPPGAGKTTRVPLALLESGLVSGRILMLEPRRLATRAAAERMSESLGEVVGGTVGYRMRGQSKTTARTRIEVVTEGVLTRIIQDTPDLPGIGAVIFDEFHERSLNADLGLALCLEVAEALRDDLMLIAMSATLDAGPVADLMAAPLVTSEGRAFDVCSHWLPKPLPPKYKLEESTANLILEAVEAEEGSVLVFLPGEGEIRRTEALLAARLPDDVSVHPLFGTMAFKDQRTAIAPVSQGRKIVLATAIAETSLTIEGIRVVVDAGRARRAEFDPSSGMARLITTRVSKAEAMQRAGRAGRIMPGAVYKLWTKGEDGAMSAFPPAEIDASDLTGLVLEAALWGTAPEDMRFVTPPHAGRLAEARQVLEALGALDAAGRITPHGRALSSMPLHPRLAHMVARGGPTAPLLAAILAERDILRVTSCDLALRLAAARNPKAFQREQGLEPHPAATARVREEAKRLSKRARLDGPDAPEILAALAYPDRVGLRRGGDAPRYILSGGKGAILPAEDPLASARLIVATDLDGDPREARVRQAIEISEAQLRATFPEQIAWHNICAWSQRQERIIARRQERFGALVLEDRVWRDAPSEQIAEAMLKGVQHMGLLPSPAAARLMARARIMHAADREFPDLSEAHLMATLNNWLLPFLSNVKTAREWRNFDILPALEAWVGWECIRELNIKVPGQFTTPLGRKVAIDYSGDRPAIAVRLQELFGVTHHPTVAGRPLQVTLLSPAQRPVQVTDDLPGFWASSYADVRKDMRGRYPKHPWPEDPTVADPTLRAKPR
ncbi:MAG: ATP-dependent helicase HrpB [Pseudomonadota bacterium]